jgi:hypothetical protein
MRFKALADFTYRNGIALFFVIATREYHMFSSSHWSLTTGFTNFTDVEVLDFATRKKIIKKKPYREGLVWKHFIGDFKNAGFIFRSKKL